jgi:CRP/FNR family cyclic AMP-dependent transcriptional regulator
VDFSSFFNYPESDEAARQEELTFLADCSNDQWSRLFGYTETRRVRAGDLVLRRGETERTFYIVAEGTLEVLLPAARGRKPRRMTSLGPGAVTGEVAFLDGQPRSADVRAVTDAELLGLRFEAFEVLAAREPELGRLILLDLGRILAARLRAANLLLGELLR